MTLRCADLRRWRTSHWWMSGFCAARRLAGVLVRTAVGAFFEDWMLSHAHTYAAVLPAFVTVSVTASVIAIASVALKQEPARPAGSRGRGGA